LDGYIRISDEVIGTGATCKVKKVYAEVEDDPPEITYEDQTMESSSLEETKVGHLA
jgi:hypothetical protein